MAEKKDSKKKASKPLDKKSMKKTKGGLLPASPDSRYAGKYKYAAPTDPIAPAGDESINFSL